MCIRDRGTTTPVGRYPEGVTPEGLYDMSGNVWEWMENNYSFGLRSMAFSVLFTIFWSIEDKRLYGFSASRALRGAYYNSTTDALRCSSRVSDSPGNDLNYVCFRVIRSSHSST